MNCAEQMNRRHLSPDLLMRSLDGELSTAQNLQVERHLAVCQLCRGELESLRQLSGSIELMVDGSFAASFSASDLAFQRKRLQSALEAAGDGKTGNETPGGVMRRFGWGMAIAATLAFGILLAPRHEALGPTAPKAVVTEGQELAAQPATIEVDGESFTPLPYSNPDLPLNTAHVVQMQVPVSSLSDVGIVLEPVVSRINRSEDASVIADVLLGSDGQPRGVHVLADQ